MKNKTEIKIDKKYLLSTLKKILEIPSPSGFTHLAMKEIEQISNNLGYEFSRNNKGGGIISIAGKDTSKTVALTAHLDTLGAMVRSINTEGHLLFTKIGGPILNTYDGEYCTIITSKGKKYRGTFLSKSPATHVYPDANSRKRDEENMYIRLDAIVKSKEDTEKLGIANGDYIALDVKYEESNGYVKSRFLDDKASVACILTALKYLSESKIKPQYNIKVIVSNYEEIGHGASFIPPEISEMLAVDMGCIGLDLSCTEQDVSICAKDSSGPYDYEMVQNLKSMCESEKISYAVDIYPFYGSDASAALRAGANIRAGLIGPGVHASHGMERTHEDALVGTTRLIIKYLI